MDSLIRAPDGRPQVSVFYLAHLSDVERQFFVTLLLDQVRAWLRVQEGTSHLRAMLYIDELYGMMPPYPANPPTKAPLLALLKQARSQGLGVVLASQNPVDLDYKGLSNAGTWFVGKLQTDNDRQRVLEGLGQAAPGAASAGSLPGRAGARRCDRRSQTAHLCAAQRAPAGGAGPVPDASHHELLARPADPPPDSPVDGHVRACLKLRRSIRPRQDTRSATQSTAGPGCRNRSGGRGPSPRRESGRNGIQAGDRFRGQRAPCSKLRAGVHPARTCPGPPLTPALPALPGGIDQVFMPVHVPLEWAIRSAESEGRSIVYQARQLVYRPALLARATARIDNSTHNVHKEIVLSRALPEIESDLFIDWEDESISVDLEDLDDRPSQGARFAPVPEALSNVRRLRSLERDFAEYVYRRTAVVLTRHPLLKLTSRPDELASEFRIRCYKVIAQKRDDDLRALERRTEDKVARLEARIRQEERELEQDELEYDGRKREELISAGESVLNLLRRRRQGRMLSVASRRRRLTQQAKADIEESLQAIEDVEAQIQDLLDEAEREEAEIQARWSERTDDFETVRVRPRKSDIFVEAWSVVWLPGWEIVFAEKGGMEHLVLPAFGGQESA